MTDRFQNVFAVLARVLLAALFLPAGISKIAGFAGTVAYIGLCLSWARALRSWLKSEGALPYWRATKRA